MNQPNSLLDQITAVRENAKGTLLQISSTASRLELPSPSAALSESKRRLDENRYKVLVVGEAKRGKSTLVNALLGKDILPTNVDIATSQVFLVTSSQSESCRLRFEDDSTQPVRPEDLQIYGSQVAADAGETPRLGQIIRWIEVDTPAQFLPEGISILDTPGLGSLNAAHDQITQRFIPQADAVIYTLDSKEPIGERDLRTIEQILKATAHVFFVQTHIDCVNTKAWQELRLRSEDVLRSRFGKRLASHRVWPISAVNLMKAAKTGDRDYEVASKYPEMMSALQRFLFRSTGWTRTAQAVALAADYHGKSRTTLAGRLTAASTAAEAEGAKTRKALLERKKAFEKDWGESGEHSQEVLKEIRRISELGKNRFLQVIQAGGDIETQLREKVDSLESLDQAKELGERLGQEAASLAVQSWSDITAETQAQCAQHLEPFFDSIDELRAPLNELAEPSTTDVSGHDRFYERIRGAFFEKTMAAGVVYAVMSFVFPPLAVVAAIGAAIWGFIVGGAKVKEQQLARAKQQLYGHLSKVLNQIRQHFCAIDLPRARKGVADDYFSGLVEKSSEQIREVGKLRLAELSSEMTRLEEQARADAKQRSVLVEEIRKQLSEWDTLARALRGLVDELNALDKVLATES